MKIETYHLEEDVKTAYVQARSFPEGIAEAHTQLKTLIAESNDRYFFGVSRPNEKGVITYMAAVQLQDEMEATKLGLPILMLQKGNYIAVSLRDFSSHPGEITEIFQQLLKDPRIDPQGYCVEMYLSEKDVRCMVRLKT